MSEPKEELEHALTLTIECHCGLTSFSVSIPHSSLPLKSAICHCNSCRHATGQIFATFAVLPVAVPEAVLDSGHLVRYISSSVCDRWFCRRCGASVLNHDKDAEPEEWEAGTGVLRFEDGLEGKLNRVQLWVEDVSGDAGAAAWINRGHLVGMDRHWRGRQSDLVSDKTVTDLMRQNSVSSTAARSHDNDRLRAHCHCRNVTFSMARPDQDLNQRTGKFEANLDACTSCRLVTGFEITSWITVPRDLVCIDEVSLDTFLADRSKLGHYQTSSHVDRYFCVKCGATIFYHQQNLETFDVGAGLLDTGSEGKARAEDWLAWQPYPEFLSYQEDAIDKEFVTNLAKSVRPEEVVADETVHDDAAVA
ncbi:hypothetical protein A1O3_10104 [Capronia epimyces CBS 606.96]|uniref:CENP-V/GFA domain-containing protein n=1 Tax=Capronia epimyces CBS 606.96 TaxID=1182542 RepID=W9X908_9EURO|nr:uncharacterized protein A1O3_10104 [Capronia epimyces CBS 606.96]EXJ76947.1 hypothetical protein A1O3_10104 [Capronia epimyces CBS 606.96]